MLYAILVRRRYRNRYKISQCVEVALGVYVGRVWSLFAVARMTRLEV